jgi:cohesin complex subunit SA-1/2
MDQVLAQGKIEVSATSKVWEPQRAYEKRLTNAMSKEKGPTRSRKGKGKDATDGVGATTTDEEPSDGEGLTDNEPERRSARLRGAHATAPPEEVGEQTAEEGLEPGTPKPRVPPRPRPTRKRKSPPPPMDNEDNAVAPDTAVQPVPTSPLATGTETTPKPSRKRTRDNEDDDMDVGGAQEATEVRDTSPDDGEIRIRRKRVRH